MLCKHKAKDYLSSYIESKFGILTLSISEKGLKGVVWKNTLPHPGVLKKGTLLERQIEAATRIQIQEYLNGQRKTFDLPVDLDGTEFQNKVWEQLLAIPYGHTASYKEVASAIGNKNAGRAVGAANGKNPLCLIVPCHRVIATSGALGGYSGGVGVKAHLLKLERLVVNKLK